MVNVTVGKDQYTTLNIHDLSEEEIKEIEKRLRIKAKLSSDGTFKTVVWRFRGIELKFFT